MALLGQPRNLTVMCHCKTFIKSFKWLNLTANYFDCAKKSNCENCHWIGLAAYFYKTGSLKLQWKIWIRIKHVTVKCYCIIQCQSQSCVRAKARQGKGRMMDFGLDVFSICVFIFINSGFMVVQRLVRHLKAPESPELGLWFMCWLCLPWSSWVSENFLCGFLQISHKHAGMRIRYAKLPLGVNECAHGALWCIPISHPLFLG